jgi:hypothetical protein
MNDLHDMLDELGIDDDEFEEAFMDGVNRPVSEDDDD